MSKGFAGWVYRQGKGDIIFDTKTDDRWHFFPDDTIVTGSAMAVPLVRRSQINGIMTLTHPEPHGFTPRHLALLEIVAAQAAAAIENAAMYTEANNERQKLQAIISGVQDIIFVVDLRQRLALANPAAGRNLGLYQEAYGRPITEVLDETALIEFSQLPANNGHRSKDIPLADGRVFNCSLVKIPEVGNVVLMHDVTTFKQLDALKSEFVSHVSHDLKAPLAVIQGYIWLLDQMPEINEEARSYVQSIFNSVDRMLGLISNLLDLGKIEMGIETEFQDIDLAMVVLSAVEHVRPLADEKKVLLNTEIGQNALPVRGSSIRLEQAVANLVGNALKFTPPGGCVAVRVGIEGSRIMVRVTDNGPGIPPALQAKLFQKFSRLGQKATKEGEGHGLGLAIVKSIVDAHQGQVWVESEPGKGSTFGFALPRLASQA
jgi:two-component system NtrC family sensor kinase